MKVHVRRKSLLRNGHWGEPQPEKPVDWLVVCVMDDEDPAGGKTFSFVASLSIIMARVRSKVYVCV
jgi:hypothetical protein